MAGGHRGVRGMQCSKGCSQQLLLPALLLAAAALLSMCSADELAPSTACTGAACSSAATSPPEPYDLDAIPDLTTLLRRHQAYQMATLLGSSEAKPVPVKAVVVNSNDLVGLGNRVPAVVTGFVLALLTKRLFFLNSSFQSMVELPFPGDWALLRPRVSGASCNVPTTRLIEPGLDLCEDLYFDAKGHRQADIWSFASADYDLPLMQINPTFEPHFKKFFPDGEVFAGVIRHLLHPKPVLQAAMQPYRADAQACVVGMHIRTRKYGGVRVKQFTSIVRMLAQGKPGTVFVASDASLFPHVQRGLPHRKVWWSDHTEDALQSANRTRGANPGTELSAMLDMLLLAQCKNIVLTPASSLGAVAAGYAGVAPVFANFGKHSDPFLNPWFWKSSTTEPCFFKAAGMHVNTDELSTKFRDKHPMYLYHNQCHYQQHLRAVPHFLKLFTNDTSYIDSLLN